jgi:hypothetical protein
MQLHPFNPGSSPCAGACTLEWAADQVGVGVETPTTFNLPAETPISWMSYAKGGVPYGYNASLYTVQEHTVMGYMLPDGSYMVQFWECGNWAIVHPVFPTPVPVSLYDPVNPLDSGAFYLPPTFPWQLFPASYHTITGGSTTIVQPLPPVEPVPPPVEAVPLPAGGLLLLCALVLMRSLRR